MDVFEAIRTVLAVRRYQDKPVPEATVRRIVEAGRLTGSAKNMQPWHFLVVRDRETQPYPARDRRLPRRRAPDRAAPAPGDERRAVRPSPRAAGVPGPWGARGDPRTCNPGNVHVSFIVDERSAEQAEREADRARRETEKAEARLKAAEKAVRAASGKR